MTPDPHPATPTYTVDEQVAIIRAKLAEKTIGSERNTYAVDNPIWNQEEKP